MRWIAIIAGAAGLLAAPVAAQSVDPDLAERVCGADKDAACEAIAQYDAGAAGTIVEVGYGPEVLTDRASDWGCRFDPHGFEGGRGYWLVGEHGEPELIIRLCNDGYGAAQVGEDSVTIADNRVTHEQYGGSAWRWLERRTLALSAPRAMEESYSCSAYSATALWAAADDWRQNRTWIAWIEPGAGEGQDGWCPAIDAGANPPTAPAGFDLGLAINGYAEGGERDDAAALAACGTGVTGGVDPLAAAPDTAPLALIAMRDADQIAMRLIAGYDSAAVPAGSTLRLAWTDAAHTMVETRGLDGRDAEPEIGELALSGGAADGKSAASLGPWTVAEREPGRLTLTHAPFEEPYESNLMGLAAALVDPSGAVIAATVPWGEAGPALTPRIAWRSFPGAGEEDGDERATASCAPGPSGLAWPVPRRFPMPFGL